jgi:hypothetical protein
MSSKDGPDVSWFYDAEQREHSPTKDFSVAEIARRPWKAFWPPRRKKTSTFGFAPHFQRFFHGVSTPTSLLINLGGIGLEIF